MKMDAVKLLQLRLNPCGSADVLTPDSPQLNAQCDCGDCGGCDCCDCNDCSCDCVN